MWLGNRKHSFTCVSFILLFVGASGQVTKSLRLTGDESPGISHSINPDGSVVIEYHLDELIFEELRNANGDFFRLNAPGHIASTTPGKPELPVYSKIIALPANSGYKIKITGIKSKRIRPSGQDIDGILYPAQESQAKRIQKEKPEFRIDRQLYSVRKIIRSDTVTIEPLGVARGSALGTLTIKPVHYNPGSNILEAITAMRIQITFEGGQATKSASNHSTLFSETLLSGVLNPELVRDYSDKPVGMIILTDTAYKKQIEPFVKWKTQKGFRVQTIYKGQLFAGNTAPEIKETLSRIYNSATEDKPAADYLLIVGNIERIPCFGTGTTSNYTDMYYVEYTGNGDYIPEMYVGRIPAKDTAEVRLTLEKIIMQEKLLFEPANEFFRNSLATTGYDPDNKTFMNGQVRYLVTNYLTPSNNITEKHFLHYTGTTPDPWLAEQKDSIIGLINDGISFINYSGHGDENGWLHLNIKTEDISTFDNSDRYPVVISNACRTGAFNLSNSFGSSIVLAKDQGAAGFIGCSNDSYWNEDYYWTVGVGSITENPVYAGKGLGAFDRLFHTHTEFPSDWFYTLGQINYAGNLSVSSSTSLRKKYYWETYNIIGDPSMIPILGEPVDFDVDLPDSLPNGLKALTLTTEPFSYVAISHFDTLWDASFGSISGAVNLELPGISNDSCLIVITGQNKRPLIKTVYISDVEDEFLNLNKTEINDALGNNNKKADFKEQIYLSLSISNMGLSDAHNVRALISSGSEWITIENDSAFVGTLTSKSGIIISDKLAISIADDIPDQSIATINLVVKSNESENHYPVDVTILSPVLSIAGLMIDDAGTGNGDHIADPGETVRLIFRVRNDGSSDATGQFRIATMDPGLSLIETQTDNKTMKAGQITDMILMARISGDLPSGSYLDVTSNLNSAPFFLSRDFNFRIGKLRESFEAESFNVFPWINISPVPWIITQDSYYDGMVAARSGTVSHGGSSVLVIKINYPEADTLKFRYKVSSEQGYDLFIFNLNGEKQLEESGEKGWTKAAIPVKKGLNKLEWIYKKDKAVFAGSDCAWIDMIDFSVTGAVSYIRKDLNIARIVQPISLNHVGLGLVRVKVLNSGKDIINGFNLGFSTDNSKTVIQSFGDILVPGGDSTEVIFRTRADLSGYGNHILSVYSYNNMDDYHANDTLNIEVLNTEIKEAVLLYPNPVKDKFTLFINSLSPGSIKINICNTAGTNVYTTEREIGIGGTAIEIPCANLPPATWYLSIKGAINKTVSFIKLN